LIAQATRQDPVSRKLAPNVSMGSPLSAAGDSSCSLTTSNAAAR
jgi:hypothetical protein